MQNVDITGWTRQNYIDFYHNVWGCPCIPVKRDKKAMVKWGKYQDEMPAQADYDKWFGTWGAYGIAIVLRSGLFSLDLDTDELYQHLKSYGAFPRGTCIYKSKRGYHALLRAKNAGPGVPYSVAEHSEDLGTLDPLFLELGIGGINHLSIMPDTPDRLWLPGYLFDELVEVDYEDWLETYIGWSKRTLGARDIEGDISIWCPLHNDKREGDPTATPSLIINANRNSAHCFGCGWHGNLWQLNDELNKHNLPCPPELEAMLGELDESADIRTGDYRQAKRAIPPALIDRLISGGRYGVTQIAADSGEGKTTVVCCIAASVGIGSPTFGGLPTRRGVVTIIDYEGIRDMLSVALEQLLGGKADEVPQNQINIISKDKGQFNVMVPSDKEYIIRQLKRYRTDLCILDSLIWFLDDPNDQVQVDACKDWLERIQQEVGCSILIMMHTSKNPFGAAYESPYGILGNMLKRWVSSKLGFGRLKGSDIYSMIEGRTRQWGMVRHFLGYREDRRSVVLLDTKDIPARYLADLERGIVDSSTRIIEQLKIIAKEEGIQIQDLAELLQVDRRSMTYWASGENQPSTENYNAIMALRDRIISDPSGVKAEIMQQNGHSVGTKSMPSDAHVSNSTPTQKVEQAQEKPIPPHSHSPTLTPPNFYFSSISNSIASLFPYSLSGLEAGEALCDKCKLKGAEGGRVEGRGYGKNDIMLLGEAPGPEEAKQGSPFVGPSGKYLDQLTKSVGIDIDSSRVTNACLCYPGRDSKGKVKKPPLDALRRCAPRLKADIDKYKPKMIIMLGEVALKGLFSNQSMARLHGKCWQIADVTYTAMYHPAAALHNPYYRPIIKYDWEHLDEQPLLKVIDGDYRIDDDSHFDDKPLTLVADVETTGLERNSEIIGGSLSPAPGKACYYPTRDGIVKAIQRFKPFTIIGHNLKFDLQKMVAEGLDINAYDYEDTDLKAYCIGYDDLRLKSLETQELNLWHPAIEDVMGKTKTLVDKPVEVVGHYCSQDVDSTGQLNAYFDKVMDEREFKLYNTIEKPLLPALCRMEQLGLKVNLDYVRKWDKQLAAKYNAVNKQLLTEYDLTDEVLNSPKQLGDWLSGQGIKLPKTDSGQVATGKELLAAYIDKHDAIPLILQRRQYSKLRETYASAYLTLTDADGLLHAQYNQTRVVTGRTSCSNPNLQNLPHAKDARRPFVARPGNKLLRCDYSQIDMRVLAHLSQDKHLLEAFAKGEDVHNMMSDMLFGDHDANHRYLVKSASYMMLFLGTPRGLYIYMNAPMGEFNIRKMGKPPTEEECEQHLKDYYEAFPGIPEYHKRSITFAYEHGYIDDYYGRRRYFPKLASSNRAERRAAEREVVNMPIAGTASSIFKLAITLTDRIWTPVMHVHDEVIFDIPEDKVDELRPKLEAAMISVDFPVPLVVKSQVGDNLGELL